MRQIEQTPTRRTFAKLPVAEKKIGWPMAIPMMNIYGTKKKKDRAMDSTRTP